MTLSKSRTIFDLSSLAGGKDSKVHSKSQNSKTPLFFKTSAPLPTPPNKTSSSSRKPLTYIPSNPKLPLFDSPLTNKNKNKKKLCGDGNPDGTGTGTRDRANLQFLTTWDDDEVRKKRRGSYPNKRANKARSSSDASERRSSESESFCNSSNDDNGNADDGLKLRLLNLSLSVDPVFPLRPPHRVSNPDNGIGNGIIQSDSNTSITSIDTTPSPALPAHPSSTLPQPLDLAESARAVLPYFKPQDPRSCFRASMRSLATEWTKGPSNTQLVDRFTARNSESSECGSAGGEDDDDDDDSHVGLCISPNVYQFSKFSSFSGGSSSEDYKDVQTDIGLSSSSIPTPSSTSKRQATEMSSNSNLTLLTNPNREAQSVSVSSNGNTSTSTSTSNGVNLDTYLNYSKSSRVIGSSKGGRSQNVTPELTLQAFRDISYITDEISKSSNASYSDTDDDAREPYSPYLNSPLSTSLPASLPTSVSALNSRRSSHETNNELDIDISPIPGAFTTVVVVNKPNYLSASCEPRSRTTSADSSYSDYNDSTLELQNGVINNTSISNNSSSNSNGNSDNSSNSNSNTDGRGQKKRSSSKLSTLLPTIPDGSNIAMKMGRRKSWDSTASSGTSSDNLSMFGKKGEWLKDGGVSANNSPTIYTHASSEKGEDMLQKDVINLPGSLFSLRMKEDDE